jgi:L-fuculose-phosphate aldolase
VADGAALAMVSAEYPAVLLKGHGLVTRGRDVRGATVLAVLVERACRAALAARAAGVVPSLPDAELAAAHAVLENRDAPIWAHLVARHGRDLLGATTS